MIRLLEDGDCSIKKSSVEGAGKGLFSKKKLKGGTIIPYNTLIKKYNEVPEDEDDTYYMGVSYVCEKGEPRTIRGYVADGNPNQPFFKRKRNHLVSAAYVNEASSHPPNCVFVSNPIHTKENLKRLTKSKPELFASCFLVIPWDIEEGQELFTMYGSSYSSRKYKQWRDRKGYKNHLIDSSHAIIDNNKDYLREIMSQNKI